MRMMPISAVRARAAGHDEGGEHGPQLPDQRKGHRRAEEGLGPEARQGQEHLEPKHHAGEGAGEEHDDQRAKANEVEPLDHPAQLERRDPGRDQRLGEEAPEATQVLDSVEGMSTQGSQEAHGRR
jgi:hypothetical protein